MATTRRRRPGTRPSSVPSSNSSLPWVTYYDDSSSSSSSYDSSSSSSSSYDSSSSSSSCD